ncbi:MAG: cupin domain-containing protein [Pseudomonadota bacterium]
MSEQDWRVFAYALGEMSDDEAAQFDADLVDDAQLQQALTEVQVLIGSLAEGAVVTPSAGLRDAVLGTLDAANPLGGFVERLASHFEISRADAQLLLDQVRPDGVGEPVAAPWRQLPYRGTYFLAVPNASAGDDEFCALVYMQPGTQIPHHRHHGREHMLILDGWARENGERVVGPGDEVISDSESAHKFSLQTDRRCVFAVRLKGAVSFDA